MLPSDTKLLLTEKFNHLFEDHAIARNKALRELKFKMARQGLLESSAFNKSATQVLADEITQFTQRLWSELETFLRETHFAVYPGCEQDFTELFDDILAKAAASDLTALGSLKTLPINVQKSRLDFHYKRSATRMATNVKILCKKLAPMNTEKTESKTDPRTVFVVHGRNEAARKSMFDFLRAIGLKPLEWSQAIQATGEATPYIGQVLDTAFSIAQAVVVLMTPDDIACLRKELQVEHDPEHEKLPTGQARPNVLFEAGMAMGRNPKRTVLVEMGTLRPFSDVGGRHVLRLNNSSERRQELANRLRTAGCDLDITGTDWHRAGLFDLESTKPKISPKAQQALSNLADQLSEILATGAAKHARSDSASEIINEVNKLPGPPQVVLFNEFIRPRSQTAQLEARSGAVEYLWKDCGFLTMLADGKTFQLNSDIYEALIESKWGQVT